MNNLVIPFNKPTYVGKESKYFSQVLNNGHVTGDGEYTQKSCQLLEKKLDVSKVLLTTSCTHALEMAAILLDLKQGDEVIVPSFTFVSTVNAFVLRGASPVFIDIRPDTLNLNESHLEGLITEKTRAIVVVHYAGVACEMDAIMEIANRHNIPVIEDNAHGLFAKYKGRYLGTFGDMATQSFHGTKNFTCGEGGAIILNKEKYIERAEIIREKGTNRSKFFRGQVDKYTWVDVGSSYLPSDLLAAVLYAQLEARDEIQGARKLIWNRYHESLKAWGGDNDIQLPYVPEYMEQAYHMFYLIFPSLEVRKAVIDHLKSNGISAVFHYLPLHNSPMGKKYGGIDGMCPLTEQVSDTLLRLPFYTNMTDAEQNKVIKALLKFSV